MFCSKLVLIIATAIFTVSQTQALQFAFTTVTCDEVAFQYTLDKSFESSAKTLLINQEDETVASFDLDGQKSGTGKFDPKIITRSGEYSFVIALASDACDALAEDGSCYEPGKKLDAVSIVQQATCSENNGEGTGDDDVELPGTNGTGSNDYQEGNDGSEISPTTAIIDENAVSSLAQQASTVTSLATPTVSNTISPAAQVTASIVGSTQPSVSATPTNAGHSISEAQNIFLASFSAIATSAILIIGSIMSH